MKNVKLILLLVLLVCFNTLYGQTWKEYRDSAKVYQGQKNTDKAIEFYNKALAELKQDSLNTDSYAEICNKLAVSLYHKQQYEDAEKYYTEAKITWEKLFGKDDVKYIQCCYNLANLYKDKGDYNEADSFSIFAKQAREIFLGKHDTLYASSCDQLASIYYLRGKYDKAEPLYLEAMQIQESILGKTHPDYSASCNNLALVYIDIGLYEKAEPLLLQVKQIKENSGGKGRLDYAALCNNLALLYCNMGQLERAEPLYIEAKQIREKLLGKEHRDYAAACNNLGVLYLRMGEYEKAEELYLEAKRIREKVLGKEHPLYAQSCHNLAELYRLVGQYKNAEALYLEAKQIQEKILGKEHPYYASSCNDLAELYWNMGQDDKAEALYLEAKQIQEKVLGKQLDYSSTCNNLAVLYIEMRQYDKSEALLLEAKQIREKVLGNESNLYASSCDNLAELYKDIGQYEKAKPLYIEAKEIRQRQLGNVHPEYGAVCEELATLYWAIHKPLEAEKEFKESFAVNSYNLNAVFQFTNEKEKGEFIKNISGQDDKAYSFYLSQKLKSEQPYVLSLFHRNLILSSSVALNKKLFYSNDTDVINKYNGWLNLKKYLSVLYSKPINERTEDPAKIEDSAGIIEKELTHTSAAFKKQPQNVDWKDIRGQLKPGEAAIEFASFHFYDGKRYTDSIFYIASVLRGGDLLPSTVFLFNEKKLNDLLFSIRNETTNDGIQQLYRRGNMMNNGNTDRSIYDLVWKPLEKRLKGIRTIYFSPSGILHRIAFAALPVNTKEVLSDRYKLVQLTTTASVAGYIPTYITASDSIQFYGGIKYDADSAELNQSIQSYANNYPKENSISITEHIMRSGSFNYLPGTKAEIDTIESQAKKVGIHATILSGSNATEESFKALDGKSSPSVIHIATHGFFFPDQKTDKQDSVQGMFETSGRIFKQSDNPLFRSGLLFAGANNAWRGKPVDGLEDGILTAYEVSNMYLPNTKLVVLSACETALGDIQGSEGVYGLQRAFKIAGVQNLVMSLWKVPDMETAEFMQLFYQNLFAKQSINEAFDNTQKTMRNKYRDEPYKWAAWVLIR